MAPAIQGKKDSSGLETLVKKFYIRILLLQREIPIQLSRFFFHCPPSTDICIMVESNKMEETVNQKFFQLFIERQPVFPCLSFGLMNVHNDVSEQVMIIQHALLIGLGVRLREREDVCCFVDPPVRTIDLPHPAVIDKKDTQFRTFKSEMMESCRQELFYSRKTYLSASLLIPYVNFHW